MLPRSFLRGTMIVSFDRGVPLSVSAVNLPHIDGQFAEVRMSATTVEIERVFVRFPSRCNKHRHLLASIPSAVRIVTCKPKSIRQILNQPSSNTLRE